MNLIIFLMLMLLNASIKTDTSNVSAVTYNFSGGRFGDNLISYLHAKWISYKYEIPLLYKPFQYSEQLVLHEKEKIYKEEDLLQYKNVIEFKLGDNLNIDKNSKTLYVIPYFAESLEEYKEPQIGINLKNFNREKFFCFEVNWNDEFFLKEIKELIKPINKLNLIFPPKDLISIAVHVRKNSGGRDNLLLDGLPVEKYDPTFVYLDIAYPLKCACDMYYIEQIKNISQIFKNKKIYVYIFTDDPNPEMIAQKYKNKINNDQIIFDYRKTENNYYTNVLEDFFSLLNFDCLIRSDSNFSLTASKVGSFDVQISPVHHKWVGRKLLIDQVKIEFSKKLKGEDKSFELLHVMPETIGNNLKLFKATYLKNHIKLPFKTNSIAKKIHQIWIGPKPLPEKFRWMIESIKKNHPHWEYKLWTNKDLEDFDLINKHAFNQVTNIGAKADIFRYEILYRHGGVYLDIDFESLKPLDKLVDSYNYDFFGCLMGGTEIMANGLLGSCHNHPILQKCIKKISQIKEFDNHGDNTFILNLTGPYFLTKTICEYLQEENSHLVTPKFSLADKLNPNILSLTGNRIGILPSTYFFPLPNTVREEFWNNKLSREDVLKYVKPESLAIHYWATSWQ